MYLDTSAPRGRGRRGRPRRAHARRHPSRQRAGARGDRRV